jgi:tRNA pseudouridine55 synthase
MAPDLDNGFLLLDKPPGPTSHDLVLWTRRVLRQRRVGHCGTLDPMASGLLIVGLGPALRFQARLSDLPKVYRGRMRLGLSTDTDDITGRVLRQAPAGAVPEALVRERFRDFLGHVTQRVPRYSAVKVRGRRLYDYARAGVAVEAPQKEVRIDRFDLRAFEPPDLEFEVECSKGTYVRALARDVGEALGVGATLTALVREAIGPFTRAAAWAWTETLPPGDSGAFRRAFVPAAALGDLGRAP